MTSVVILLSLAAIGEAIGLLIIISKRNKQISQSCYDHYIECNQVKLDKELEDYRRFIESEKQEAKSELAAMAAIVDKKKAESKSFEDSFEARKKAAQEVIDQYLQRQDDLAAAIQKLVESGRSQVDSELAAYRTTQQAAIDKDLDTKKQAAAATLDEYLDTIIAAKKEAEQEVEAIRANLEDFKQRQAAYNAEISRRRELEEKQDFYRIMLSDGAKRDIEVLREVKQKLGNPAILDKLIYDAYVAKPVAEMVKRVLAGRTVTGIYKITRLKTGEIYVGKATDVTTRWLGHSKTAFNVGAIAHSVLHTTMERDGIDNFTFELLEEVPKDKLSEREKYWITFFDSKNYGLNERIG